jgi:hypothetical protein
MRIVDKKEFYNLPSGTLYSEFEPSVFVGLKIKGDTIIYKGVPTDFFYEDLIGNVDSDAFESYFAKNGIEFNLDFDTLERDGLYEDDGLFAIYSKDEIIEFSQKIASCLGYDSTNP